MSENWENGTISISNLISFDVQLSQYFFYQRNWPICATHCPNMPYDPFHWDWIHSGKVFFKIMLGLHWYSASLGCSS